MSNLERPSRLLPACEPPGQGTAPRPGGTPPRWPLSAGHRGPKACRASRGTGTASCRPWDVTSKCQRARLLLYRRDTKYKPVKACGQDSCPSEGVPAGRGDANPPGRSHLPPCGQQALGFQPVRPSWCMAARGRPRPAEKVYRSRLSLTLATYPEARPQGTEKSLWRRTGAAVCVLHLEPRREGKEGSLGVRERPTREAGSGAAGSLREGTQQPGGAPASRAGAGGFALTFAARRWHVGSEIAGDSGLQLGAHRRAFPDPGKENDPDISKVCDPRCRGPWAGLTEGKA